MNGEKLEKFYRQGLQFHCTSCGNCCRLPGGKVSLSTREVEVLRQFLLQGSLGELERYAVSDENGFRLRENTDHTCPFLQNDLCVIYPIRPLQCRTFPFWPENLKSKYRWKQLRDFCPGIDRGSVHHEIEIRSMIELQEREDGG